MRRGIILFDAYVVPTSDSFRSAMAGLPTGVAVVTAAAPDPSGATVNAVGSLSLSPPLILACLDVRSRTLAAVRSQQRFAVNVLHAGQADLARRFASREDPAAKWEGVAWRNSDGLPRVDSVAVFAACEVWAIHAAGDHEILIGEVSEIELDETAEPLVFWRGEYGGLGREAFGARRRSGGGD
ncbi:flavin reductase family protein [Thermoleophilia bacterium SCSIO 60948]|nr:flavin reductase family protein [Thermoleophilia bacterium SCSIO 60948]